MTRATADASDVLAALEGRSDRAAARMAGVSESAMRAWRRTGRAAPLTLDAARQRLASNPPDPTLPPGRPPGPGPIDVHCTKTSDGWIIDAYHHGTNEPVEGLARAARRGQRWPTLEDAHRFARRRFGDRLAAITPELTS